MKPQDIGFFIALFLILYFRPNPKWVAGLGLFCLLLSMPLFSFWVFFTAQRLVWYAAAFFLLSAFFTLSRERKNTL